MREHTKAFINRMSIFFADEPKLFSGLNVSLHISIGHARDAAVLMFGNKGKRRFGSKTCHKSVREIVPITASELESPKPSQRKTADFLCWDDVQHQKTMHGDKSGSTFQHMRQLLCGPNGSSISSQVAKVNYNAKGSQRSDTHQGFRQSSKLLIVR